MTKRLTGPNESNDEPPRAAAAGAAAENSPGPGARSARPRAKPRIASEEECLAGLSQLPGLLTLGVIAPKLADSMRGAFNSILQHYRHQPAGKVTNALDQPRLQEIVRANPELVNLLEPLLTDVQIELLLKQSTDGDDVSA